MSRLERWSRRKLGDEAAPETLPPETAPPVADTPPADGEPRPVNDEDLPVPEDLPPGSDFSRYLQEGVSQALRRRALRRLWQADHYQVRDGLDDYDGDYSQLETMTREVAERLHHWSRQVNDALEPEENVEAADPAEKRERVDEEGAAPPASEPASPTPVGSKDARDQGGIGHISDSRRNLEA